MLSHRHEFGPTIGSGGGLRAFLRYLAEPTAFGGTEHRCDSGAHTLLVNAPAWRPLTLSALFRRQTLAVAATLLVAIAAPAICATPAKPAAHSHAGHNLTPGVPVATAQAESSAAPRVLSTLGIVDSLGKTTFTAPVTGEIEGPFQSNGEVAAGMVVARNVPAALHGALADARAQLQYARIVLRMTQQLARQRLRTALAVAQAQRNLVKAKNQLANLQRQAGQQVLRAPFAGTVHYLLAPGTVVYRGTPVATIMGKAQPWIDVRVTPGAANGIKLGEAATIRGTTWRGAGLVIAVGQDARPWGLVRVRIGLPTESPLIPGEWVRVRLMHAGPAEPFVPRAAVVMRDSKAMVFVVRHHRAYAISVRVVAEAHRQTWVEGRLRSGDKVVVGGVTRLADGSPVVLAAPTSAH